MQQDIRKYVAGCSVCQRVKEINQAPAGLLQPWPIPSEKFEYWTIDIITGLPEINDYNALVVCVYKFRKLCHLIPCRVGENALSATKIAQLFFDNVVQLYGVPCYVPHDCNPRFTAQFWRTLWKIMGCKTVFTSAYHP